MTSIVCLTPNPAVDITYRLETLVPAGENRIREVDEMPGGKGLNTARILAALGHEVTVVGPLGGPVGAQIEALLQQGSTAPGALTSAFTRIGESTRRTVVLTGTGTGYDATGLYEPGPHLAPQEAARLREDVLAHARDARVVTTGGSLPGGLDGAWLAQLIRDLRERGAAVIADTSGAGLLEAAAAGADVLKPNREEAMAATGEPTPLTAAQALLARGAGAVLCSLGADGMMLVTAEQELHAEVPRVHGHPTGAGDAVVAALAIALLERGEQPIARALSDSLARIAATGTAVLDHAVAGRITPSRVDELAPQVRLSPWTD